MGSDGVRSVDYNLVKGCMGCSGHFFRIFEIKLLCFVVAMSGLVHDFDAIFNLPELLITSRNLF